MMRRLVLLLSAGVAAGAAPFMTPAWACGCGAYDPGAGGRASVPTETALVRFAGDSEDVYLSLTVHSTVRTGALLFPVPDRSATVKAAPRGLFGDLATLTQPPRGQNAGGGNGGAQAPAPSVTVESRQRIGPLDVVTLTSGDATALTQWLSRNGFAAKPALATAAQPYTRAGWAFVAVRLRPDTAGTTLDGALDPLQIHFTTSDPVYPMRLSAMASQPESLQLYVLSDQRAVLRTADTGLSQMWSGDLAGKHLGADLAKVLAGGPHYLTRFDGTLDPASITDDIHFARSSDASTHSRYPTGLVPGIVGAAVALVALAVGLTLRRRRAG